VRARPAGPAQSSALHYSLVVDRRRRPIDGLWIGQMDSYVAKRGGVTLRFSALLRTLPFDRQAADGQREISRPAATSGAYVANGRPPHP